MKLLIFVSLLIIIQAAQTDLERCMNVFDTSNRTIIKSTDSLKAGANFLGTVEGIKNRNQCQAECCQTAKCNIVVFHEKDDKDCYLFDCGKIDDFKCIFAVHDDYVAMGMMVDRRDLEKTKIHEQSKHELDLSMLKAKESKPASKPAAQPSRDYDKNPYNRYPDENYDDRPKNTEYDRNQDSYNYQRPEPSPAYNENEAKPRRRPPPVQQPRQIMADKQISKPRSPFEMGLETKECGQYQWKCLSRKACVALYDLCDGVPQCPDKSDESVQLCQELQRRKQPEPADTVSRGGLRRTEEKTGTSGSGVSHSHGMNAKAQAKAPEPSSVVKTEITKEINHEKETKVLIERVESSSTSMAALVLGLGLCLLAAFLVFVSCRLRTTVKRMPKRRQGKVMDNTEGEGLINGMYL